MAATRARSRKKIPVQEESAFASTKAFVDLPNELKFRIFDYLDRKGHLEARSVCKAWLLLSNEVRKHIITLVPGQHKDPLIGYVSRRERMSMSPEKTRAILSKLTLEEVDTIRLVKLVDLPDSVVTHLPKSKHVELDEGNSKQALVNALQIYCANQAKSLIISQQDPLAPLAKIDNEFWNFSMICLNSLSIAVAGNPRDNSDFKDSALALTKFMAIVRFPVLTTFAVRLDYFDSTPENAVIIRMFEPAVVTFLDSHGSGLKEFRLTGNGIMIHTSGQTVINCLKKVTNVEKLKLVCESDSRNHQESNNFAKEVNKIIQDSMTRLTQLELLMQANYYHEDKLKYITEYNHDTLRALASRLTSLRYTEHSVRGLEAWLNTSPKPTNFPNLSTLTLSFDKTGLEYVDAFETLCSNHNFLRLAPCKSVRTLTLDVQLLSEACINWILQVFPNLHELVLDFPLHLNQVKALIKAITEGTTVRKLKYVTLLGPGAATDPKIARWCDAQSNQRWRYFRLKSIPPHIATCTYEYKNERNYACIQFSNTVI